MLLPIDPFSSTMFRQPQTPPAELTKAATEHLHRLAETGGISLKSIKRFASEVTRSPSFSSLIRLSIRSLFSLSRCSLIIEISLTQPRWTRSLAGFTLIYFYSGQIETFREYTHSNIATEDLCPPREAVNRRRSIGMLRRVRASSTVFKVSRHALDLVRHPHASYLTIFSGYRTSPEVSHS